MSTYPPPQQHEPSIEQSFRYALDWMKQLLWPFDFGKWIGLAFVLWLATLAEGGGGFQMPGNFGGGGTGGRGTGAPSVGEEMQRGADWALSNMGPIIAISAVVVVLIVAFSALLVWLRARGQFMYLDAVVTGEPKIGDSWNATSRQGNSLFKLQFLIGMLSFAYWVLAVAVMGVSILTTMKAGGEPESILMGIFFVFIPAILLYIPIGLVLGIFSLYVSDFVVPIMYRRGLTFRPAWALFYALLRQNMSRFAIYTLVRILLAVVVGILAGIVSLIATCLTCCILGLPVVNRLPILPFMVFKRAFPIFYLEQFGPEWEIFPRTPQQLPYAEPLGNPPNQYVQY
jgi:hypothetical protein